MYNVRTFLFLEHRLDLLHDHAAQDDVLGVDGELHLRLHGEADQHQGRGRHGLPGKQEQAGLATGHLVNNIK